MEFMVAGRTISALVIVLIALAVLGIIQALKGLFKRAPNWIWTIVAFVLYFAFAAGYVWLPAPVVVFLSIGILAWAIGQLGYEALWQTMIGWLRNLLGISAASTPPSTGSASSPGGGG